MLGSAIGMIRFLASVALIGAVLPTWASAGPAATVVDTFVDEADGSCADGDCSLRDAIATTAEGGAIALPSGFYALTIEGPGGIAEGDLDIGSSVTIHVEGDTGAFVSAPPGDRVIQVHGGSVGIEGLTLFGGNVVRPGERGGNGGVIDVAGESSLTLSRSTITAGRAFAGGGINVRSDAGLRIVDSIVLGNFATFQGGGISVRGHAVIAGTSFSMNRTAGHGGGVFGDDVSEVSVRDSTFARNRADVGGGVGLEGLGSLSSVTIAYNRAGSRAGGYSGEARLRSHVDARSTLISDNRAADRPDCAGSLRSLGHNLSRRSGCGFDEPSDLRGVDPRLGPFDAHGGPSPTVVLMSSSPAIDLGGRCSRADQRGAPRDRCDAGAYERVLCLGQVVNIVGTPGDDELSGGQGPDGFLGLGGDDEFQGSLDRDVGCGGRGDDHLIGGPGNDRLAGGSGRDELDGEEGRDRCWGGPGRDELIACEA
jgi:CSLREA domain-containing protein